VWRSTGSRLATVDERVGDAGVGPVEEQVAAGPVGDVGQVQVTVHDRGRDGVGGPPQLLTEVGKHHPGVLGVDGEEGRHVVGKQPCRTGPVVA